MSRFALIVAFCLVAACSTTPEERYELRGTVISVDVDRQRVELDHEAIPGYMDAMAMEFRVKDPRMMPALAPGRLVTADLVVAGQSSWIENLVVTSPAGTPGLPSRVEGLTEPIPGAPAPAFALVDHESSQVTLETYRGKAVAVTFIFTRCPLPDACPLMTSNFAAVRRALIARDPALAERVQFVSVSIDPVYDTPAVLARYGRDAAGADGTIPENWAFLTGSPDAVRTMAQAYGLWYEPADGTIQHALRTAVVAPDGRLVKMYRGNDWTVDELARDLADAAR
jgi:protein SCO1/2